jgi:hypothetical protein
VKIHIDIESPSEEGRAARRQVLMLIAAYGGGKAAYMATLEDLVNALVRGTADPVVLARRIAHFIDGATLIGFALASALAEFEQEDVAEVLKVLEDAVNRKLADAGSAD